VRILILGQGAREHAIVKALLRTGTAKENILVAPGNIGDWDANVGARALWNLICVVEKNRNKK
jgi:phosphoribosylamine-glycine ligase